MLALYFYISRMSYLLINVLNKVYFDLLVDTMRYIKQFRHSIRTSTYSDIYLFTEAVDTLTFNSVHNIKVVDNLLRNHYPSPFTANRPTASISRRINIILCIGAHEFLHQFHQ